MRFELKALWVGDGLTVAEVVATAVGRTEGVPVEWTVYMVNHLREGVVSRIHAHLDRDQAFAAAGPVVPA